jgi:Leucine-rich repeat (LRR) protein
MSAYISLEVLDISHNELENVVCYPPNITELSCKKNKLEKLPLNTECPKLIKIDFSNNIIKKISNYDNISILIGSFNKIQKIANYDNLEKLLIDNNNLQLISNCKNLVYLDCSNNPLEHIKDIDNLKDLIVNNTKITSLANLKSNFLKYIEMFGSHIEEIPYIETLEDIYFNKENIRKISKRYTINKKIAVNKHKNNMMHIAIHPINIYV